eukprot:13756793-Heterocapsa_arctica.AAC.1
MEKTRTPWFIESGKDVRADRRCPHLVAGNCKKGDDCPCKHDVKALAADLAQLEIDCDTMNTLFTHPNKSWHESVENWPA